MIKHNKTLFQATLQQRVDLQHKVADLTRKMKHQAEQTTVAQEGHKAELAGACSLLFFSLLSSL